MIAKNFFDQHIVEENDGSVNEWHTAKTPEEVLRNVNK